MPFKARVALAVSGHRVRRPGLGSSRSLCLDPSVVHFWIPAVRAGQAFRDHPAQPPILQMGKLRHRVDSGPPEAPASTPPALSLVRATLLLGAVRLALC